MLMKWLPTVIIMVQIVNIFCSPPCLLISYLSQLKTVLISIFFLFFSVLDVFTKGIETIYTVDREIPDELSQYQEKLKRLCLAARAPLTVRTYGCIFQSEVDSGHWS